MPSNSLHRDEITALESAAQVLTGRGLYPSAVGVYAKLVAHEPSHSMAWYGIGDALFRHSADTKDMDQLLLGLACVKRALAEDSTNSWAEGLHEAMVGRTPLTVEQAEACEAFGGDPAELAGRVGFAGSDLAAGVADNTSWEERMLLVSWLGCCVDDGFVPLLVCGLRDASEQVQQAALDGLFAAPGWVDHGEVRAGVEALARGAGADALRGRLGEHLGSLRGGDHDGWAAGLLDALAEPS